MSDDVNEVAMLLTVAMMVLIVFLLLWLLVWRT